jgi:multidrug efflux pump subunit AcrA (membrane-fusion protein)
MMQTNTLLRIPEGKGSRVRWTVLALTVPLVGGSAMLLTGARKSNARSTAPSARRPAPSTQRTAQPSVTVETVSAQRLQQSLRVTGTLKSDEVVALSTEAKGLVREVNAKEGDRVRKGDLLVRIDDRELQAQRDRAQAAVAAAEARLKQALTARGFKNAAVVSDHRQAEEALATARTRLSQAKALSQIAATEVASGVETARASLQAAREQLKVLQDGARRQEKMTAELAVSRARSHAEKLKANLERRERLLQDGAIAREEVENARRDYESAMVELDSAKSQADLVSEGPRSEEIRVAEEQVRQAEAALRTAEANRARRRISSEDVDAAVQQVRQAESGLEAAKAALEQRRWNEDEIQTMRATVAQARADVRYYDQLIDRTRVYSPVNGVVSQRKVHVGETVAGGATTLMTLVSTETLYFEATAPESALPYLRVGGPAAVTLDARPGQKYAGLLREIIPVAEGTARSVRLRIALPRTEATVVGGFARATLQGERRGAVLAVPASAIQSDDGTQHVFVVENGLTKARPVQVGAVGGSRVEILSGLRAGERIIVRGVDTLTDGQKVQE